MQLIFQLHIPQKNNGNPVLEEESGFGIEDIVP